MKHAGPEALLALAPLLAELRQRPALREKSPGVFYLKSKAFAHFHEDPAGLFADVRIADAWARFPVNSHREWTQVLAEIDRTLRGAGGGR